jgi:fibronectin type 3 domain-containing protein
MKITLSPVFLAMFALCLGNGGCHKPGPHSVTLTWNAPTPMKGVTVKSYNVYRSTTSGGPFLKIASHVPGPPFQDRLVTSGRTYFYVVTALDQTDHESRFSSEITAAIP